MEFVPISDDEMINVDLIESVYIRKNKKGEKTIVLTTVSGKQHIPTIDVSKILGVLVKAGVSNMTNQFFSV